MKRQTLFLLVLLSGVAPVKAQHAHQHGTGRLDIVVEGAQLSVSLDVPQHDLVGFERPAQGARELLAVQATLEKLRLPARLFEPTAAAQCTPGDAKIDAPLLEGKASGSGHGDIEASYVYRCANPQALNGLRVKVGEAFPRLRSLAVSFAGPQGQKAGRVDARQPVFSW